VRGFVSDGSWCFVCATSRAGREQGVSIWSYTRGKAMRWGICWACWRLLWAAMDGAKEVQR
jgi:hypothetical protein